MKRVVSGLNTVECAYFLRPMAGCTLNFAQPALEKEILRQAKKREGTKVALSDTEFMLQAYGSGSGYPYALDDADMTTECGEFNDPSFYVTFRSIALWHKGRVTA